MPPAITLIRAPIARRLLFVPANSKLTQCRPATPWFFRIMGAPSMILKKGRPCLVERRRTRNAGSPHGEALSATHRARPGRRGDRRLQPRHPAVHGRERGGEADSPGVLAMKPNGRKQRIRLGRLSQYRRHPGILGERRERVGRNHDHWDGSKRLVLALLGAEVPTIHARHDEVKQDEGGHDLAAPKPPKRLPSACRRNDSVALSFKQRLPGVAHVGVVFDYEDGSRGLSARHARTVLHCCIVSAVLNASRAAFPMLSPGGG